MSRSKSFTPCLVSIVLSLACSKPVSNQSLSPANLNSAPAGTPKAETQTDKELQKRIEQIAARAKAKVGVAAVVLETGQATSLNPTAQFPMQSVYKLPISMAVIEQGDSGKLKLEQKVTVDKADYAGGAAHSPLRDKYPNGTTLSITELIRRALVDSDSVASDRLMKLAGGAQGVQVYLTGLG